MGFSKTKDKLTDTNNSIVITRGERVWEKQKRVKWGQMVMEEDLTWNGEHTIQHTDDILYNCTTEACIILLTNVTPIKEINIL